MHSKEIVPTGIQGLDEVLGGGLPRGRIILIVGGPGTGKTILSTQFIINGITQYGENGIFVSLDENKFHYYREMGTFRWKLPEMENQKKFAFVNASPLRSMLEEVRIGNTSIGKKDFSMVSLVEGIKTQIEMISAERIAVDPVTSLILQYPDMIERRTAILNLMDALVHTGTSCILTAELRSSGLERNVQLEEYLAHGVIVLQTLQVGNSFVRMIQIEKMREIPIDLQPKLYRISEDGFEVYPKENVF